MRVPPAGSRDLRELRTHAAERLRPVCSGWTAAEFAALVDDVVRFRHRWGWNNVGPAAPADEPTPPPPER